MKIAIDCSGGFAGDMFTAALISAGADFEVMRKRMVFAGDILGETDVEHVLLDDGSLRLHINLKSKYDSISGLHAKKIIEETYEKFNTKTVYRKFGQKILSILLDAEKKVHKDKVFEVKNSELSIPGNREFHTFESETHLHEAQDIVIDIVGVVTGLELLKVHPEGILLTPISVGGGELHFSHGILQIPAPATRSILEKFDLNWQKGPIDVELCTPTGAAILAALNPENMTNKGTKSQNLHIGQSRGTKVLPVNPLKIFLYE